MSRLLLVVCLCGLLAYSSGCSLDTDCWLNGVCTAQKCVCDPGWIGENCTQLNLAPAPIIGAYGYSPNVSSWGGVPVYVDGNYHLFVAEMVDGCGLCTWETNSRVVHAVSPVLTGPYKFVEQALSVWAHNPQIVVENTTGTPTYIIYHIGGADGGKPKVCNASKSMRQEVTSPLAGAYVHYSSSLDGPWTPVNPEGYWGCNNPAPYIYKDGSVLLVCKVPWHTFTAPNFKGPYSNTTLSFQGNAGRGNWEDPFIWQDRRGHFHMLSHVYIAGTEYTVRVAGLAYSEDGRTWVQTAEEPYTNKVIHTNGQTIAYTSRERPKLFFSPDTGAPIALFTGVSAPPGFKGTCGSDWTFTLAQPINN